MDSFLKMGSLSLVIFLLLQSMLRLSSGCSVEERAALLEIRSSLMRVHSVMAPDSWGEDGHDCCSWERVKCNNRTRRVSHLDLSFVYATTDGDGHWYLNSTVFSVFHELRYLDLSYNSPCSLSLEGLVGLVKLRYLDLSDTMLGGVFPKFIGKFVALEVLALNSNNMIGGLPSVALENLQNLRELYLSSNQFSGNIPAFLFSLPHIEVLNLSASYLGGHIMINPSSNLSSSLKVLRLSQNNLSGRLSFIWLGKLAKLEEIDLSDNAKLVVDVNIPGWTPLFQLNQLLLSACDLDKSIIAEPQFLRTQRGLEVLDLSNNNLPGSMPNWLFTKESVLTDLKLGNNSLTGLLDPVWHTQSLLEVFDIHMNHVTGQLPANISSMFPNLHTLDFSSNNFFGHIPMSLCEMSLKFLILSNNKLSGEVPACVFSNNKLDGLIFGGVNNMSTITELYLDGNKFEGSLPYYLSAVLEIMDLHDNKLSGELDTSFWNLSSLVILNLAGNRISGKIHPQICGLEGIRFLDLSTNNLVGSIPNCSFTVLSFLNLSGNFLSGDFSYPFFNTSNLIALDIRHNQFTGNLYWLSYLENIRLLSLGGNKFEGLITPNLCKLLYLRIIDLSHNKLSGSLPSCIGNISFRGDTYDLIFEQVYGVMTSSYSHVYGLSGFSFATKGNLYTYGRSFFVSMSGIDLSANMLDGEIPWELGNLRHIKALNLSNNLFVGPIPATFGGMEVIESLDLSHNMLSGPIPLQLNQLSFLGVFSVAYNNLSGCIPNSGQLGSFGMDSYLANTNLHKSTHGNMCARGRDPVTEDVETPVDPVLYVITAAAFVLAFWATVGFSFGHPYGGL